MDLERFLQLNEDAMIQGGSGMLEGFRDVLVLNISLEEERR